MTVAAAGRICLWLHGHRHGFYHLLPPAPAPFPVICAGSATQTGRWSYGEYVLDGQTFRAQQRVYNPETRSFNNGTSADFQLSA